MNRVLVLLATAACSTLASAQPRITSLSSNSAVARAISADGRVVVGYLVNSYGSFNAFRWTQEGGIVNIGAGAVWTDARAVNADGSVVVGTSIYTVGWSWTQASGMVPVPLAGHGLTSLYTVSADGQTVGGFAANNTTHLVDAFLYSAATGFTVLPSPSISMSCYVYAMSPDASRAAGAGNTGGYSRATLWDPLTVNRSVGNSAGHSTSALALTPDGSAVVGRISDAGVDFSPYLWTAAGGGQELVHPPDVIRGEFDAVNAAATLAAGRAEDDTTGYRALIWRPGIPVMDANIYLLSQGVDLTGWTLEYINGMTPDGRTLVGGGLHQTPTGTREEAFIINLPCGIPDFNGDGDTGTDADIDAFFACLAGNCCATCGSVDFNGDGDIGTDADIESFFRVLAGQPC